MYTLNIKLPPELYQKLIKRKQETYLSFAVITRLALEEYLKEPKPIGRPPKIEETEDEKINRTIGEWLKEDPDRTITYNKDEGIVTVTKNTFIRPFNVADFLSAR